MNRKQFIGASLALLVSSTLSFGQANDYNKCKHVLKNGNECKNKVKFVDGNDEQHPLCYIHNPNYVKNESKSTQCSEISKSTNKRCKRKTKHESNKCHSHRK